MRWILGAMTLALVWLTVSCGGDESRSSSARPRSTPAENTTEYKLVTVGRGGFVRPDDPVVARVGRWLDTQAFLSGNRDFDHAGAIVVIRHRAYDSEQAVAAHAALSPVAQLSSTQRGDAYAEIGRSDGG